MSMNLHEATRQLALMVGTCFQGVATGGSATTLDDTACVNYPDDFWNGGTLWLTSGNNIGKSAIITDWDLTTNKRFTFATLTLLCAASNIYTACHKGYPRQLLRDAVNAAISDMPRPTKLDSTLTAVVDQLEYDLPSGVTGVARVTTGTTPNFTTHHWWREYNGHLYLDPNHTFEAGATINVFYNPLITELSADTDVIDDLLPWERLKPAAVYFAYRLYQNTHGDSDSSLKQKLSDAFQLMQLAKANPVNHISRDPHYAPY